MNSSRSAAIALAVVALVASLSPIAAHGAAGPSDPPLFYLFRAESLGEPIAPVVARWEYRSGERVLGTDVVLLSFGREDSLVVAIPPSGRTFLADESADIEVLVYAGGLLIGRFDRESLLRYNRTLAHTHADEVAALPGGGGIHNAICEGSPCDGGCGDFDDYDCDGVDNWIDNCFDDYNPNQEDCDNDSAGDICDLTDAAYQPSGQVKTCMTDKDDHFTYITFEHHVEQRLVDVSSCSAPDTWDRWIRTDADCFNLSDSFCCTDGIGTSILQVGDNPELWCGNLRNQDLCH